ncbi:hypothetical protein [Mycobacterium sp. C31M]
MTVPVAPDIDVLRDRVHRAGEIREEIGDMWEAYLQRSPRRLALVPGEDARWSLVVDTRERIPLRLSTLFGEWLYLLRAALDGLAYYLAVRDSGENPPPAERRIYFPIKTALDKFDSAEHRASLQAVSDETFDALRAVQPFNAEPDHLSNALWWIEELARIDRHRRGHALTAHIVNARIGIEQPLVLVRNYLPDPGAGRMSIDETAPTSILELQAPADFDESQVLEHLDAADALSIELDVTEWVKNATPPMRSADLAFRMGFCEQFVLEEIIEPVAEGRV